MVLVLEELKSSVIFLMHLLICSFFFVFRSRLFELPYFVDEDGKFLPALVTQHRKQSKQHLINDQINPPGENRAPEHRTARFPSTPITSHTYP